MARTVKAPNVFSLLHLLVSETVYDTEGFVHEVELPQPISADWISVRSILTKGRVQFEFPGTDSPIFNTIAPGAVSPFVPEFIGKTRIKSTMLTDTVEVQCVAPQPGYKLLYEEVDLALGAVTVVNKGVLMFIFGDNYSINNKIYSSFEMFAVQYNNVTINALSPCHIIIFNSVLKEV